MNSFKIPIRMAPVLAGMISRASESRVQKNDVFQGLKSMLSYPGRTKSLAKLVLEPTKHDLASVKKNRRFVKFDSSAKLSGKSAIKARGYLFDAQDG
uniref:Uncharacterized protein n=1 Tax=Candidatus Kentrum sp. LFY TaxID=2126342 RepID=A0A450WPR2_9GAMM|nr:MAG: hypothetical protein BECKLFY1418C_GA0070996_105219 [Candidatus Kentron sp. LFY]